MPVREPSWWYAPERRLVRLALMPLAVAYGQLARRRMERPPRYQSPLPVICVGNFTAGGTGKTPLTAFIAAHLTARGAAPAILTRGYGGRTAGPHWVDLAVDRAADVGDEPLQHAAIAPTLVARNRAAGAQLIEHDLRAFTHILMDDGLQNPSLAKSLRIALIDGQRGVGNGAVMPAGPLRAPLVTQLRQTDVVVINRGFSLMPGEVERPAALAAFTDQVFDGTIAPAGKTTWLSSTPVIAFAGIGAPAKFFRMLRDLGATVAEEVAYADHHLLSDADARHLLARAEAASAMLVTTEKDMARLAGTEDTRAALRKAARAVPIRMSVADATFLRLIDQAMPVL